MGNLFREITTGLFAAIIFLFLLPGNSWSTPREVTFFPDSAHVVEVSKAKIKTEGKDRRVVVVTLPGNADMESFTAHLPDDAKLKIDDVGWRQIIRQDETKIANLRKQSEKLKDERRSLQSSIRALETQIQFWQLQTKAKTKTITDANNMSASIGKNMRKFYHDKITMEPELEKVNKRISEVQEELDRATGKKETAWEVTLVLSGAQANEATLTYSYTISGCGWQPLYRLEAKPQNKHTVFSWEAEIWQSTGEDWNHASIHLATLKPTSTIAPADLPPWVIKPRPLHRYGMEKKAMKAEAEDRAAPLEAAEEAPTAPQQVRESTYSVWKIGKKTLPAGTRQRVRIQEETWPSEFTHLLRPSLGNQSFVRASIQLAASKEIPPGTALFAVDGAILGKRNFALAGKEVIIFFGVDPLVTSTVQLLSQKSGERTFLADRQTYTWDWRIDIQNARTSPIRALVEEPNPQPRDERIKLTLKHEPEPLEKTPSTLTWSIDMGAGEKKSLFTSVRLEAPKDMNLDLGWRR
jgi:uncharacterized protein (TIGR02231 family)